jgi:hypothetical protein
MGPAQHRIWRVSRRRESACGLVTGVDLNPGMLDVARAHPTSGAAVDWREDAEAL